ncbi:MAG TPA: hypothetical protein VGF02_11585 [Pseudolabrys sp.]
MLRRFTAGMIAMGQAFKTDVFTPAFDAADMAARVMTFAPATDAEALKLLRASFPECTLSMRIAALDLLMRRRPRGFGQTYSPR